LLGRDQKKLSLKKSRAEACPVEEEAQAEPEAEEVQPEQDTQAEETEPAEVEEESSDPEPEGELKRQLMREKKFRKELLLRGNRSPYGRKFQYRWKKLTVENRKKEPPKSAEQETD
jgi:hypothetical protein